MGEDFKVGDRVVVENYPQRTEFEQALEEDGLLDPTADDLNGLTGIVVEDPEGDGFFLRVRMDNPAEYATRAHATIDPKHGLFRPSELARVY